MINLDLGKAGSSGRTIGGLQSRTGLDQYNRPYVVDDTLDIMKARAGRQRRWHWWRIYLHCIVRRQSE
jgi:hypothetical protein